ncbi:MAG: hypothetical protein QG657_4605 [Acidobacteriota bacterium]|nr:hypothetical protein [Acidobacteriota bacterium]
MGTLVFAQEYDVRKLKWGMTYGQVREAEKLTDSFFKEEELLGMKMEVVFGCGSSGLYSVTYSTMNAEFVERLSPVLIKKYGEPSSDLDYSFLMEAKDILKHHPKAVVDILEKNDYTALDEIEESYSNVDERKIIKGGLAKRMVWKYGNTVVLLLNNVTGGVLSYRPKAAYEENKKKFNDLLVELKKQVKDTASSGGDVF